MSETTAPTAPAPEPAKAKEAKEKKPGFAFTRDGCRTDVRVGALLVLGSVFLWLWLGPTIASKFAIVGLPFVLWGVPMQAIQARRDGRPGYPWRLGLTLAIGGALMWPDLLYREKTGGPLLIPPTAPLLVGVGAWILLWWPLARRRPEGVPA